MSATGFIFHLQQKFWAKKEDNSDEENDSTVPLLFNYQIASTVPLLFNYQKADSKIFVCQFSRNVKSKLYHIENSKTRGQTVKI